MSLLRTLQLMGPTTFQRRGLGATVVPSMMLASELWAATETALPATSSAKPPEWSG